MLLVRAFKVLVVLAGLAAAQLTPDTDWLKSVPSDWTNVGVGNYANDPYRVSLKFLPSTTPIGVTMKLPVRSGLVARDSVVTRLADFKVTLIKSAFGKDNLHHLTIQPPKDYTSSSTETVFLVFNTQSGGKVIESMRYTLRFEFSGTSKCQPVGPSFCGLNSFCVTSDTGLPAATCVCSNMDEVLAEDHKTCRPVTYSQSLPETFNDVPLAQIPFFIKSSNNGYLYVNEATRELTVSAVMPNDPNVATFRLTGSTNSNPDFNIQYLSGQLVDYRGRNVSLVDFTRTATKITFAVNPTLHTFSVRRWLNGKYSISIRDYSEGLQYPMITSSTGVLLNKESSGPWGYDMTTFDYLSSRDIFELVINERNLTRPTPPSPAPGTTSPDKGTPGNTAGLLVAPTFSAVAILLAAAFFNAH